MMSEENRSSRFEDLLKLPGYYMPLPKSSPYPKHCMLCYPYSYRNKKIKSRFGKLVQYITEDIHPILQAILFGWGITLPIIIFIKCVSYLIG